MCGTDDPHQVPDEWLIEAGVKNFVPSLASFRCDVPHELVALVDIETPLRRWDVILDANGFGRDRMLRILEGIRRGDALPPIDVEIGDARPYRLRAGFHRLYASLATGFSHVPAEIVPRL